MTTFPGSPKPFVSVDLPDARASMESRFGHGFAQVRVRIDARATEPAQEVYGGLSA